MFTNRTTVFLLSLENAIPTKNQYNTSRWFSPKTFKRSSKQNPYLSGLMCWCEIDSFLSQFMIKRWDQTQLRISFEIPLSPFLDNAFRFICKFRLIRSLNKFTKFTLKISTSYLQLKNLTTITYTGIQQLK